MTTLTYTSPPTDISPPAYLEHLQSSVDMEEFLIALERPPTVSVKRSRRRQIFVVPRKENDQHLSSDANTISKGLHGSGSLTCAAKSKQTDIGSSESLGEQIQRGVEEDPVVGGPGPPIQQTPRVTQTYSKKKLTKPYPLQQFKHRVAREREVTPVYDNQLNENPVVVDYKNPNTLLGNLKPARDLPRTPLQKCCSTANFPPKKKRKTEPAPTKTADTQKRITALRMYQKHGIEIGQEAGLKRKHGGKSLAKEKPTQHKHRRQAPVNQLALLGVVPEPETSMLHQEVSNTDLHCYYLQQVTIGNMPPLLRTSTHAQAYINTLLQADTDLSNLQNASVLQSNEINSSRCEMTTRTAKNRPKVLPQKKFIISWDGFKYKYPNYTTPKHRGNVQWQPGSGFDEHIVGKVSKQPTKARTMRSLRTGRAKHIRTGTLDLKAHIGVPSEAAELPYHFRKNETSADTGTYNHRSIERAEIAVEQVLECENAEGIAAVSGDYGEVIGTKADQPVDHVSVREPNVSQRKEQLFNEDSEDISNTCEEIAKATGLANSTPPHYLYVSQRPPLIEDSRPSSGRRQSVSAYESFHGDNGTESQRRLAAERAIERPTRALSPTKRGVQPECVWQVSKPIPSQCRMEVMEDINDDPDLAQLSSYHLSQRRQSYWPFGWNSDLLEAHEGISLVCHAKRRPAEVLETQERPEQMGSVEIGPEYSIATSWLDTRKYFSQAASQFAMHDPRRVRAMTGTAQAYVDRANSSRARTQEACKSQRLTEPEMKDRHNSNRPNSSRIRTYAGQSIAPTEGRTLETLIRQASIELGTIPSSRRKLTTLPFVPPLKVNGNQRTLSSQLR